MTHLLQSVTLDRKLVGRDAKIALAAGLLSAGGGIGGDGFGGIGRAALERIRRRVRLLLRIGLGIGGDVLDRAFRRLGLTGGLLRRRVSRLRGGRRVSGRRLVLLLAARQRQRG